jgi:putative N6-adenine-specific DNA methylase
MNNIELIATSAFGLESVLAVELKKLGYADLTVENGKVTFARW